MDFFFYISSHELDVRMNLHNMLTGLITGGLAYESTKLVSACVSNTLRVSENNFVVANKANNTILLFVLYFSRSFTLFANIVLPARK